MSELMNVARKLNRKAEALGRLLGSVQSRLVSADRIEDVTRELDQAEDLLDDLEGGMVELGRKIDRLQRDARRRDDYDASAFRDASRDQRSMLRDIARARRQFRSVARDHQSFLRGLRGDEDESRIAREQRAQARSIGRVAGVLGAVTWIGRFLIR